MTSFFDAQLELNPQGPGSSQMRNVKSCGM